MDIGVRFTLKVTAKIAGQRGLFNDIFKQPVNIDLSNAFSRSDTDEEFPDSGTAVYCGAAIAEPLRTSDRCTRLRDRS